MRTWRPRRWCNPSLRWPGYRLCKIMIYIANRVIMSLLLLYRQPPVNWEPCHLVRLTIVSRKTVLFIPRSWCRCFHQRNRHVGPLLCLVITYGLPTWYPRRPRRHKGIVMIKETREDQVNASYKEAPSPPHLIRREVVEDSSGSTRIIHQATTRDIATPEEAQKTARGTSHDTESENP